LQIEAVPGQILDDFEANEIMKRIEAFRAAAFG
jgi:hypothetical protein